MQAHHQLKENLEQNVQNPGNRAVLPAKYVELQAVQAMSHAMRHNSEVSAMVMSFDNIGALRESSMASMWRSSLQQRFISMLSSKIRKEDSLGHYAGSQLVVISPGTPAAACESFGNRLRGRARGKHRGSWTAIELVGERRCQQQSCRCGCVCWCADRVGWLAFEDGATGWAAIRSFHAIRRADAVSPVVPGA